MSIKKRYANNNYVDRFAASRSDISSHPYFATPDGASGGGFSPTDISGLWAWLDAVDGSTVLNSVSPDVAATDGQTVRRWVDKSGNSNNADQATGISQPLKSDAGLGGLPALVLDGVNDSLSMPLNTSATATLFCVMKSSDTRFVAFTDSGGSTRALMIGEQGLTNAADSGSGSPVYRKNGAVLASPHRGDIYTELSTGAATVVAITGLDFSLYVDEFSIGGYASTYQWGVTIGELIVYNATLSVADVEQVESYLSAKWGVALA
jgi:hypothetical protein